TNSYSTGSVIGYGDRVGGLVGQNYQSSITNSYWDTETSGQSTSAGGIGLTTAEMKDINNYLPEWDFVNIWGTDPAINDGYPYLRTLETGYTSWLSNYKIVGIPVDEDVNGYVLFPEVIAYNNDIFNKYSPIYNADGDGLVNPTGSDYFVSDATTGEVGSEINRLWHIDELNTERITAYLATGFKFLWFVKNRFEAGTYTPTSIKEILVYGAPITDADDLSKIKRYIKYDWEI
ncbi:MAG: hypothetical protein WCZ15_00695, partial [Patescibacteria group bacterium]